MVKFLYKKPNSLVSTFLVSKDSFIDKGTT